MSRTCLLIFLLAFAGMANTQEATLSIGYDGEVVAGSWNPFEFSFRDLQNVTLTFTIDQGDLRSGSLPAVHTFELAGGPGLSVIEDDLFIPSWQSFTWSASTPQRVVASGSFHPRDLDARPLTVVLSTGAARHSGLFPAGTRLVGQPAAALPERLAAWDGVELLLIDGTTAPPSLEAVAAAAVSGASVMLLEPFPASFSDLLLLTDRPVTRLGAGQIVLGNDLNLLETLPDTAAIEQYLSDRNEPVLEQPVRLVFLAPLIVVYSVLVVMLLRIAGLPGAVAGASVGILAALLGWQALRPEPAVVASELQLRISAGGLSRSQGVMQLLDRTGGEFELTGSYRLRRPDVYSGSAGITTLTVRRWQPVELMRKPALASASSPPADGGHEDSILMFFPEGSTARVTDDLIEVFLPELLR